MLASVQRAIWLQLDIIERLQTQEPSEHVTAALASMRDAVEHLRAEQNQQFQQAKRAMYPA
jgi:hypothetical protein